MTAVTDYEISMAKSILHRASQEKESFLSLYKSLFNTFLRCKPTGSLTISKYGKEDGDDFSIEVFVSEVSSGRLCLSIYEFDSTEKKEAKKQAILDIWKGKITAFPNSFPA